MRDAAVLPSAALSAHGATLVAWALRRLDAFRRALLFQDARRNPGGLHVRHCRTYQGSFCQSACSVYGTSSHLLDCVYGARFFEIIFLLKQAMPQSHFRKAIQSQGGTPTRDRTHSTSGRIQHATIFDTKSMCRMHDTGILCTIMSYYKL